MSRSPRRTPRLAPSLIAALVATACGGGGGGSGDSGPAPLPPAPTPAALPAGSATGMSCTGGAAFAAGSTIQCSGDTILRTDNGVSITRSGVQAYTISTSDLATPNPTPASANGLRVVGSVADGSRIADLRVGRTGVSATSNGVVQRAVMLLDNLNVRWNGLVERPRIIEAFEPTRGITQEASGAISVDNPLPVPPNPYYNYTPTPLSGTQANYANNRYFPAPGCAAPCAVETTGITFAAGTTGDPDRTTAHRKHGDGDVRAGNPGGLPAPESKGFRDLTNFNYRYANVAAWATKETNLIDEWTGPGQGTEHTVHRRGVVAYGDTTPVAATRLAGTVLYRGIAYGWYTANGELSSAELVQFRAVATLEANFATGQVGVYLAGAVKDGTQTAVPVALAANAGVGAPGTNVATYMTGAIADGGVGMSGGMGARFFGPAFEEIAGTFVLKNDTTKATTIGGFIVRR